MRNYDGPMFPPDPAGFSLDGFQFGRYDWLALAFACMRTAAQFAYHAASGRFCRAMRAGCAKWVRSMMECFALAGWA